MGRLWPPKGHPIVSITSNIGFCCRLGGFVWWQWKVPTRKERLWSKGKRCANVEGKIAFAKAQSLVVVVFNVFFFLFCCKIQEKDGSKPFCPRGERSRSKGEALHQRGWKTWHLLTPSLEKTTPPPPAPSAGEFYRARKADFQ